MSWTAIGDPLKGEIRSGNASAGIAVPLYPQGQATIFTQGKDQRVHITDIIFISTAGGTYSIVFYPLGGTIADTVGLRIAAGEADVDGGLAHHFETPVSGPVGYGVALIAAVGQVDLIVTGGVTKD